MNLRIAKNSGFYLLFWETVRQEMRTLLGMDSGRNNHTRNQLYSLMRNNTGHRDSQAYSSALGALNRKERVWGRTGGSWSGLLSCLHQLLGSPSYQPSPNQYQRWGVVVPNVQECRQNGCPGRQRRGWGVGLFLLLPLTHPPCIPQVKAAFALSGSCRYSFDLVCCCCCLG